MVGALVVGIIVAATGILLGPILAGKSLKEINIGNVAGGSLGGITTMVVWYLVFA